MGLTQYEAISTDIDLQETYKTVRRWYKKNIELAPSSNYGQTSRRLIRALKPASAVSAAEMNAVMGEILYGLLEWGFHSSDSKYKMAQYAKSVVEQDTLQRANGVFLPTQLPIID